jgi:uncharacterized alkaline shock family protein YloU
MATKPKVDTREIELPDTLFVRDIENRVFQAIALQCLARIPDVSLVEGNLIDNLLARGGAERIKGVTVEQDSKNRSVKLKVEVNVRYGVSIPEKAEQIQLKVAEEITKFTGLHVAAVHVVFKGVYAPEETAPEASVDPSGEAPA